MNGPEYAVLAFRPPSSVSGTAYARAVGIDDAEDSPRWQVHGERTLYDNRWVRLTQVEVETPDGNRWWHHVVRLQRCVIAVVLDEHDRVLLLWRHRFVPDEFGWELPGGIVEADEDAAVAAAREAEEETGWRPTWPMRHLITFQPMAGMVDSPHEVFLAEGADYVGEPTDSEEAGRVEWVPLSEIPKLIQSQGIAGSGSLVGLLYVLALGRSAGRD